VAFWVEVCGLLVEYVAGRWRGLLRDHAEFGMAVMEDQSVVRDYKIQCQSLSDVGGIEGRDQQISTRHGVTSGDDAFQAGSECQRLCTGDCYYG